MENAGTEKVPYYTSDLAALQSQINIYLIQPIKCFESPQGERQ